MSRIYHVRSEGNNTTSGATGSPTIIVSFSFYENAPGDIYFSIETHSSPDRISGVFTASTLVSSYTVTNGSSYRARSTGTNTCTLDGIGYTAPPALSSLPAVLWEWGSGGSPSIAADNYNTGQDDNYIKLYIPWTVTFLGTNYATGDVYLGSNTYLTFGAGSTNYSGLTASNPNLPKIMIGCGDNSFQRVRATSGAVVTPTLGSFDMTRTFGDSAFIITQPTSDNTSGAFTYSVTDGYDVISIGMDGTTITIAQAGTATVQASQAASGNYLLATKTATITINRAIPTLVTSQSIIYKKFVSGAIVSFDFISSSAGAVSRTYELNGPPLIITIPTASTPSASIVAPGKNTIKVTQYQTTNYAEVVSTLITIVIIGQGQTYTSETFLSLDLSGTNLSGSTFSNCTLTDTNLFGTTVSPTTNFTSSTLKGIMSGRIIGTTDLLPPGFKMI